MSQRQSNELPGPRATMPEAGVFGSSPASPTAGDLDRTMRWIAAQLRRDFVGQIAEDARNFKKRAVHKLKLYLPPGPGRPAEASITRAIAMRREGQDWKRVYPQSIPNHAQLDPAVRRQAESNLRSAIRSRRNARRRRIRRRKLSAARTAHTNVSPVQAPRSAVT